MVAKGFQGEVICGTKRDDEGRTFAEWPLRLCRFFAEGAEVVRFSTCCRRVTSLSVWQRRPWCWYLIVTQMAAISHHYDPTNQAESLLSHSTNDWRALSTVLSACVGGSINDHHAGLHMLCTRCQVRPGCKHSTLFPYTILRTPIKGGMTMPNIATFDHGTHGGEGFR